MSDPGMETTVTARERPSRLFFKNGKKTKLPFSRLEYERRLLTLRKTMDERNIPAVLTTSMHNTAYFSGYLYCSFGRPYGCVITEKDCTTVSANIDGGQPWRRSLAENVVYTDWRQDNFWRAVAELVGPARRVGIECDHLTITMMRKAEEFLPDAEFEDISTDTMFARMMKSPEEIALIRDGARVADIGGEACRSEIRAGVLELDVAAAGRDAMEREIARSHPNSEIRDSWVWIQSGLNTDGAHNPLTARQLRIGDFLSMNCFPMISGYYTALERTLYLGEPDNSTLRIWQTNVAAHELGLSLIRPGISCSEICTEINRFLEGENLLDFRSFGYGHSFGILSHYYGREAGLEFREDIGTVLEPGMVVSMEPMLTIPEGMPGAGGYREHDVLLVTKDGSENLTGFPYGPDANII